MKVSDVKDINSPIVQQYQKNEAYSDKKATSVSANPEEKVDLSTQAKEIQQIKNALSKVPDIREEKVREIRNQVEKGTYNVSGEKIAGKMVGESIIDIFA